MSTESLHPNHEGGYTKNQRLFIRWLTAVLIDLTVLNLFDEYWDLVVIESFSISLLTALLLQVLLKATIIVEHKVSHFFDAKGGGGLMKFLKYFSLWLVLFGSKFVILGAIDWVFGDEVLFLGAFHGIVAFIAVIVVMLVAEEIVVRATRALGIK